MKKEANTQAKLQAANELLLQRDRELEAKQQKAELKKVELEKKLQEETVTLEDAKYAMFEQGFNEVVAQVKHLNIGVPIDISVVDREKNLKDILA